MSLTSAERVRAYRTRRREAGEPDATRANRRTERKAWKVRAAGKARAAPFVGCDGEGAGTDEAGRQNYLLLCIGDRQLYTGQRLTTADCLKFICDQPAGSILVGFAFGYDVTMILRDLSEKQQRRLFEPKDFGPGHSPFVWYRDYDIDYLPKNYLKVRRVRIVTDADGKERRVPIKGSTRTIYETFGFFQKSFLKVISEFDVGTEDERAMIARNKDRRSDFASMGPEERQYCLTECRFLAELMEKLREYCDQAGIRPRSWSGAGKLAGALHTAHATPKTVDLDVPPEVSDLANMAYYGGRFEITRVGQVNQRVFEYDIRSAYPDAMSSLPCLLHGAWESAAGRELSRERNGLFVASVRFKASPAGPDNFGQLGALPVRSKEGHLFWPLQGSGVYWSPEIRSAERLGFKCRIGDGWRYIKRCDCKPFEWVEDLFDYRRSIGAQGPGYPIKLGINALYGILAQRKGNGKFVNMVWAGLITAITRARLNDAAGLNPGRIIMLATDALYSLDPIPELELGDWLGAWELAELDGLFIVQPGLYWCPAKRKKKSRGLSGKFFEEPGRTETFERDWEDFRHTEQNTGLDVTFPVVAVPVPGFIGLKLAVSRNKPDVAGTWVNDKREISFDYRNKRVGHTWDGESIVTKPKLGGPRLYSLPHRDFLKAGGAEPWEILRSVLEEQPDYVDLGIPWKD